MVHMQQARGAAQVYLVVLTLARASRSTVLAKWALPRGFAGRLHAYGCVWLLAVSCCGMLRPRGSQCHSAAVICGGSLQAF